MFCFCLLITATPAQGVIGHEYLTQLTETSPNEKLEAPGALAIDSANNLWVSDPGRGVVDEFDASGSFLRRTAGGHFGEEGKRIDGVAVAPSSGNLYVADAADGVIDVFNPQGEFVKELNGATSPQKGFQKVRGEGDLGVAIDQSTGGIYVASIDYDVIDKFNSSGEYQLQIASVPAHTKSMAAFGGSLYVIASGTGGNVIEKYDSSGNHITAFGDTNPTHDGRLVGKATPLGTFNFEDTGGEGVGDHGISEAISSGLTTDSSGHLYVVDSRHKVVDEFSALGEYLGQIGGGQTPQHHLIDPGGVAVDSSGNIYLADFDPNRSSASEGTGVVDVFGPEVEQNALEVSITGGANVDLGGGLNSLVLSSPPGIEEMWGSCDPISPLRLPIVAGTCVTPFSPNKIVGCEWKCSVQFAPGTKVALTETSGKGFKFKEWSKGCSGEGPCEVTLGTDVEVGAEFEALPEFILTVVETGSGAGTVTSKPSGIVCPSTCSAKFSEGEKVSLKAEPAGGSEFVKWIGCEVEPSKSECEVSITKAMEVKAEFNEILQHTLSVVGEGSGGGMIVSKETNPKISCPSTCSGSFDTGAKVILEAEPNSTSRFVSWTGCEAEPKPEPGVTECEVTVSVNGEVKANFVAVPQVELKVSVSGGGSGVVSSVPVGIDCGVICAHEFNEGTVVRLTAQPRNASSVFVGWVGGGCSGTGVCEVALGGSAVEVMAEFGVVAVPGCSNEVLRGEQSFGGGLPDCRAYELVSPVDKNGNDADVNPVFYDRAAVSGDAVTYESKGSFGAPSGAPFDSQYLSHRGDGGWVTRDISPPTSPSFTQPILSQWSGMDFAGDLSKGLVVNGDPPLAAGAPVGFESLYVSDIVGGSYEFVAATQGEPYQFEENTVQPGGASADLSHVVFEKNGEVFEWANGQVSPVSNGPGHTGSGRDTRLFDGMWRAVSVDGSRVFFTRRESGFANEEGQVFVRENESSTVGVSASQRTVVDPNGPRPALFWGASADGSRAFFTSAAELTDDANTGSADNAPNLYEYDVESGHLSDLTVDHTVSDTSGAGVDGVVGMSEDGSYVYFVASGVLASGATAGGDNLYVSHGGVTSFIATLGVGDVSDWAEGIAKNTAAVTPGGSKLAFQSKQSLTGYDNQDQSTGAADEEVFEYDAETKSLVCVSCVMSGVRPVGSSSLYPHFNNKGEGFLYKPRSFSDDGSRLFFDSGDALVGGDGNGRVDVYEFEDGFVSLISSGKGSFDSFLQDVSGSGDDVFFVTAGQLVSQDQDGLVDLYDARVGGGFPAVPVVLPGCNSGELCKPPMSSPPAGVFGVPGSSTVSGPGNVPSVPPPPPVVVKKVTKRVVLSRAQRLAAALKVCRKKPRGKRRVVCEGAARKRYGPVKDAKKTSKAKSGVVSRQRRFGGGGR
jgi:sugar lactone lactonase YvrE